MAFLVLQAGGAVLAATVGGMAASAAGLPTMLGGLLVGIAAGLCMPDHVGAALHGAAFCGVATIAAVLVLFRLGLEADLRICVRRSFAGLSAAICGAALSFVLGDVCAVCLLPTLFESEFGYLAQLPLSAAWSEATPLCMGIAAVATSASMAAKMLAGRGRIATDEGACVMSGALIDNALLIAALAACGVAAAGHTMSAPAMAAVAVSAYVAGGVFGRTRWRGVLEESLAPVGALVAPAFFCMAGMLVEWSWPMLAFGLAYALVAVVAKVVGCAFPSLVFGFGATGALRVGLGMTPRGEAALVVACLGLVGGFVPPEALGAVAVMVLLSAVVSHFALMGLCGRGGRGPGADEQQKVAFELPDVRVAKFVIRRLVNELRREGFKAIRHVDEPALSIWQMVMGPKDMILTRRGRSFQMECSQADEAVVSQAWMEVVSEMSELARTISKPVLRRSEAIKAERPAPARPAVAPSDVVRCVQNYVMEPSFRAHSKREAIERLIALVVERYPDRVKNVDLVRKAVFAREESMPTGLNNGVAVPHGRTDEVTDVVGAVALVDNSENENGIIPDYEMIDHSKVQIIVLTLVPESIRTPYLQVMAFISQLMRSEESREALLACTTADEMRRFFRSSNE